MSNHTSLSFGLVKKALAQQVPVENREQIEKLRFQRSAERGMNQLMAIIRFLVFKTMEGLQKALAVVDDSSSRDDESRLPRRQQLMDAFFVHFKLDPKKVEEGEKLFNNFLNCMKCAKMRRPEFERLDAALTVLNENNMVQSGREILSALGWDVSKSETEPCDDKQHNGVAAACLIFWHGAWFREGWAASNNELKQLGRQYAPIVAVADLSAPPTVSEHAPIAQEPTMRLHRAS